MEAAAFKMISSIITWRKPNSSGDILTLDGRKRTISEKKEKKRIRRCRLTHFSRRRRKR